VVPSHIRSAVFSTAATSGSPNAELSLKGFREDDVRSAVGIE
jgi:hypothetical protein